MHSQELAKWGPNTATALGSNEQRLTMRRVLPFSHEALGDTRVDLIELKQQLRESSRAVRSSLGFTVDDLVAG
jgi:hypothetical protein